MGRILRIFLLFLVASMMTGCATLSRDECRRGDWYGIGLADGRTGAPESRLNDHNRACSEFGIRVDSKRYFAGRAQGLVDYCRLENAFETGLQGHRYQHVCSPTIDAMFDRYNRAAYEVYKIKAELDSVHTQIRAKEHDLRKQGLSDDKLRKIRSDLRELDRRRDRLRDDLYTKERYMDLLMDQERHR